MLVAWTPHEQVAGAPLDVKHTEDVAVAEQKNRLLPLLDLVNRESLRLSLLDFEVEEFTELLLLLDFEEKKTQSSSHARFEEVQKSQTSVLLNCHLVKVLSCLPQCSPPTSSLQKLAVRRFGTKTRI